MTHTLTEIKQWRSHLQASPHTLQRIDALIGMVESVALDCMNTVCAEMLDCRMNCTECPVIKIRQKYRVGQ